MDLEGFFDCREPPLVRGESTDLTTNVLDRCLSIIVARRA